MNYFHLVSPKSQRLRDFRRSRMDHILEGNSGQALIEYILMVVVTIILLVGLTFAFFTPLQDFLARLNNTYIKCLLETGELPRVGTDAEGICDAEIPSFEAKDIPGGSGIGASSGGSNTAENEKGESSSADGDSGTDASGSGSGAAAARAASRKSSLIRDGLRTRGGAKPELGQGKTTNIPVDRFEAGEGFQSSNPNSQISSRNRQKARKIDLSGLTEYDRRKIENEKDKSRSIAVDSESFTQTRNKKLIVKPPEAKKMEETEDSQTDFGYYFKIFFFIIILLFIIILMGTQAMQLTNNSDS
jgi:hypothetical protein